jgi:hypothetical protein
MPVPSSKAFPVPAPGSRRRKCGRYSEWSEVVLWIGPRDVIADVRGQQDCLIEWPEVWLVGQRIETRLTRRPASAGLAWSLAATRSPSSPPNAWYLRPARSLKPVKPLGGPRDV